MNDGKRVTEAEVLATETEGYRERPESLDPQSHDYKHR